MAISRLIELDDGKYRVLRYPSINKYLRLIALEKINPRGKESDFFIFNRDKDDQPKFLQVGLLIIKKTVKGKPVISFKTVASS